MSTTTLEKCRISPSPATVGERSLPLNFFDAVWLLFFPIHQVFFYDFPHPTSHFLQSIVPKLKHSLSITLQHFFPFAGNLIIHPNPNRSPNPEIRYVEGDSVPVTFAQTGLDYDDLVSNHPRECNKFYPLVPVLEPASKVSDYVTIPLFAVQVTIFPNKGIAIGLTNHHSLCDATTRFNFLKAWTDITKHGTDESFLASGSLPVYARRVYPSSLNQMYFNQPGIEAIDAGYQQPRLDHGQTDGKVRATIILNQAHINRLKKWVLTQQPSLEYVSSFSVACGYVWSCIAKSKSLNGGYGDDDLERFICAVDWRSRMNPPLPETYFGNCVGPCITSPIKSALLASNEGLLTAVEVFGKALSETLKDKDGLLKDAGTWLERAFDPMPTIGVSGTPKVKIYDIDFGWGKPRKHETPSIDYNGSISVNASKEAPGDVEIGISLPVKQMDAFIAVSRDELERIFI